MVIQRGRDGLLVVDYVVVTDPVEFIGGDASLHVGADHFENFGRQAACDAHFFYLFGCFDRDRHGTRNIVLKAALCYKTRPH